MLRRLVAVSLATTASADAARMATPANAPVALHGGPDAATSTVTTLAPRRYARVRSIHGNWTLVTVDGHEGWGLSSSLRVRAEPTVACTRSQSIGTPGVGRIDGAVLLPRHGVDFFAWDWRTERAAQTDRARWGNCTLIKRVMVAISRYRARYPDSAPVVVGDIGLRHGGEIEGHGTHENGLAVDVYYPRKDRRLDDAKTVSQVDTRLAKGLLHELLRSGARHVLIGQRVALPTSSRVTRWPRHDDHFHVTY